MKKVILGLAVVAMATSSCVTRESTSATMDVETSLRSRNAADLAVSDKVITYTFTPSKAVRRAGLNNVKRTAVAEALKQNGGGEVLVAPQYQIVRRRGLFATKIKSVTVSGHPASYKNFRQAPAECKPACHPCHPAK